MPKKKPSQTMLLLPDEEEQLQPNIILIDDPRWEPALEALRKRLTGCVGLDIETYGNSSYEGALSPYTGEIRIISCAFYWRDQIVCLLADLGGLYDDRDLIAPRYQEFLKVLIDKCQDPGIEIVGQNLVGFEYEWFAVKYECRIRNIWDTMLASQVYWAGLANALSKGRTDYSPHALDSIAERLHLGELEKSEKTQRSDWGLDLNTKQINYAAMDAVIVLQVKEKLEPKLRKEGLLKDEFISEKYKDDPFLQSLGQDPSAILSEMLAAPVFGEIMVNGMPVDVDQLDKVEKAYKTAWEDAIRPFKAKFPYVNAGSPKQLTKALNAAYAGAEDSLGLLFDYLDQQDKLEKGYGKGNAETDLLDEQIQATNDKILADLLQKMEAEGIDIKPIKSLLLWRSLGTQVKYLENVRRRLRWSEKYQCYFGFSKYQPLARTGMGRSSCRDFNSQNPSNLKPEWERMGLPNIRTIFKVPPGYKMLIIDLSQAHAQIAAWDSMDPALISAYTQGRDVHLLTVLALAELEGKKWDYDLVATARNDETHPLHAEVARKRLENKSVFYGSLNLQGAETLQATAATQDPPVYLSLEQAQQGRNAWNKAYEILAKHQRDLIDRANKFNHILRDHLGKRLLTRTGVFGEARGLCGRRMFLEKYENETAWGKVYKTVKATDTVSVRWMSTEATAIKLGMGKLQIILDQNPEWGAFFVRFAHDEANLMVSEEYAHTVAQHGLECLGWGMSLFINYSYSDTPEKVIHTSLDEK